MAIVLDGSSLTLEKLVRIARFGENVELAPAALERIKVCRAMLEEKLQAHEIMYGVNTGIGEFSEVVLNDEQVKQFQRYLIYNHAAGIGDPAPDRVRPRRPWPAASTSMRTATPAAGPEITQTLVEMLNKGVTPVVCQKGSVGACGDLAPMAQIALLLMGEGEAFYQGERLPGRRGDGAGRHSRPRAAGARRPGRHQRLESPHRHERAAPLRHRPLAEAGRDRRAMTLEALLANLKPYDVAPARAARLRGRGRQRDVHHEVHRGERSGDRQDEDQGAGRLLDALHAAGHRRGARRGRATRARRSRSS